jgi:hypothetical protein
MPALYRGRSVRLEFIRGQAQNRRDKSKMETAMSVSPIDELPGAACDATRREGFWQRLARSVDRHFADRSRRAVSPTAVRRSKYDIRRCRRLLDKSAPASAGARQAATGNLRIAG